MLLAPLGLRWLVFVRTVALRNLSTDPLVSVAIYFICVQYIQLLGPSQIALSKYFSDKTRVRAIRCADPLVLFSLKSNPDGSQDLQFTVRSVFEFFCFGQQFYSPGPLGKKVVGRRLQVLVP